MPATRGAMDLVIKMDPGAPAPVVSFPSPPFVYDFFVSTTGGTGTGSLADPWSLAYAIGTGPGTAIGDGKLTAGKHIGVRGGIYNAVALSWAVSGTAIAPLIWRNYNNERAHIRGASASTGTDDFMIDGNYNIIWGIELSHTLRSRLIIAAAPTGNNIWIRNTTNGTKFVHCINHDQNNGWFSNPGCGAVELYGNICYNMGFDLPATGGQNHGYYIHHDDGGGATEFAIEHGISFNHNLACCQVYSGGGAEVLQGIKIRFGIFFNSAAWATLQHRGTSIFFGGDVAPPIRGEISDTVCHWPAALPGEVHIDIGKPAIIGNGMQVVRNYLTYGGGQAAWAALHVPGRFATVPAGNFQFRNNFIKVATSGANKALYFNALDNDLAGFDFGLNTWINNPANASWSHANGVADTFAAYKAATGLSATDTASAVDPVVNVVKAIPTNRYESGRGHVWFYNWQNLAAIPVDLSPILNIGDAYQVFDCRDAFSDSVPIMSGIYVGGTVNFPNTQVADKPLVVNPDVAIADSTPTTPIQITTATPHGYLNGDVVRVFGHTINTNANGVRAIVVLDATNFTLTGSASNGDGGATGTVSGVSGLTPVATAPFFNAFVVKKVG